MKTQHRQTLWIQSAFSAVMCAALVGMVLIRRDTPTLLLAGFLFAYILGNTAIHLKRGDFKKDTLYEYLLLGFAVFVVVSSAAIN